MKTKIAIVVQRYGQEVNGGAEQLAKMLAERFVFVPEYDVEVLTTRALDYTTWENHYSEGVCDVNGIKVRRFTVDKARDFDRFSEMTSALFFEGKKFPGGDRGWVDEQGPYCPSCVDYIKEHRSEYDVFIFFTYLFYLTIRGLPEVRDKAILVPTAHDEPPIYLKLFEKVFSAPRAFSFNTVEERDFVCAKFNIANKPCEICGIGIDIPENMSQLRFIGKHNLSNYLLYAGRIDDGKNCPELFDYFIRYKARNPSDLKLVLIGDEIIPVPEHPDIVSLGFVSDEEKTDAMAGAKLFVLPSVAESLSIVVLESMALGIPVVVNRRCDVLRGHCLRSNAGLYYGDYFEFEGCLNYLCSSEHRDVYETMQKNAWEYVNANFCWDVVIDKYKSLIETVKTG